MSLGDFLTDSGASRLPLRHGPDVVVWHDKVLNTDRKSRFR